MVLGEGVHFGVLSVVVITRVLPKGVGGRGVVVVSYDE